MLSVIVPNYNHSKYLQERLDSIVRQTYQDFELIILDDNSADDSRTIIEQYRNNPKVSAVVYNEVNSGSTFRQWKKGIELAKGEYVWIAESDDVASADFLEKMMLLMERHQSAAMAFCDSLLIDETGAEIVDSWIETDFNTGKPHAVYDGNRFLKKYLLKGNVIYNASAVIFRKAKALEISGFEQYRFCGDWFFWSTIMLNAQVVFCNEKLNRFRQHSQKVTRKADKNGLSFLEGFDVIQYVLETLRIPNIQKIHIGVFYVHKIKTDPYIASGVIRDECMRKCKSLFSYLTIGQIVFFIPDKAGSVFTRIRKKGFISAVTYYLTKYSW
jgi:glycosyltransferase involved in cell wall biosynthesis